MLVEKRRKVNWRVKRRVSCCQDVVMSSAAGLRNGRRDGSILCRVSAAGSIIGKREKEFGTGRRSDVRDGRKETIVFLLLIIFSYGVGDGRFPFLRKEDEEMIVPSSSPIPSDEKNWDGTFPIGGDNFLVRNTTSGPATNKCNWQPDDNNRISSSSVCRLVVFLHIDWRPAQPSPANQKESKREKTSRWNLWTVLDWMKSRSSHSKRELLGCW